MDGECEVLGVSNVRCRICGTEVIPSPRAFDDLDPEDTKSLSEMSPLARLEALMRRALRDAKPPFEPWDAVPAARICAQVVARERRRELLQASHEAGE